MARTIYIARHSPWTDDLGRALDSASKGSEFDHVEPLDFCQICEHSEGHPRPGGENAACVYVPSLAGRDGMAPDLAEAERVLSCCAQANPAQVVVLSSALIYGTGTARAVLVSEDYAAPGHGSREIPHGWKAFETLATQHVRGAMRLTILRPVTVLPSPALLSRRLLSRFTLTLPGHDPTLQCLSIQDLAEAILCALNSNRSGIFNVAPDSVVPLHAAIRLAGGRRFPWPRTLQRLTRSTEALEYLRYSWTVSSQRMRDELGFAPRLSSAAAVATLRRKNETTIAAAPDSQLSLKRNQERNQESNPNFDVFGMDRDYIESRSRTLFKFLCDHYWRIEVQGLKNIPRHGPAILVGTHRGFMPWDAVMALHVVLRETGRIPRFLTHPGLLKFPFIATFVAKLGGVVACQESADRVLANGELLGVFPEGVQGAFIPYHKAYQLQGFGRDAFAKLALRHRLPIIPFVNVGSAEALPVFWQIKSRLWTRYSDWPCLPVSTFPLLPVPLPSKWHIQFLPPLQPQARVDDATAKKISREVRRQMQQAIDEILQRRRSVFYGSVFGKEDEA